MSSPGLCVVVARRYEPRHIDLLRAAFPDVRFARIGDEGILPASADEAEVLLTCAAKHGALSKVIRAMPKLRWIHSCGAGFDQIDVPEVTERKLTVTRSAEAHAGAIGEFALGMILLVAKRFPELLRLQARHEWRRRGSDQGIGEISGRTVGILGAGVVGREIARRCGAMGMRVLGIRRTGGSVDAFDHVLGPGGLPELLRRSDYVVISLPLTSGTRGLIGAKELRMMQRHAYLINVARGGIVVQEDLIEALRDGAIAGLCSDVFDAEPLPDDSPLWDMPNVVITPHCASDSPMTVDRGVREFQANLARYLRGEPLTGLIDVARGY